MANAIPVFMMKDLRRLYQEMLRNLDTSEEITNNVNVIRLKEEILEEVPAPCEQRNGKFVLLTLGAHVGKALFDVTQNSHKDDGIVLSRAAKIIRKHMFDKEEILNGDLSKEKQKDSVPSPLLHLISLILVGGSMRDNYNDNSKNVAVNIGQLIKFNTVKHKRQTSSATRHSKKNEPPIPVKIGLMVHAKTRKKSLVEK